MTGALPLVGYLLGAMAIGFSLGFVQKMFRRFLDSV